MRQEKSAELSNLLKTEEELEAFNLKTKEKFGERKKRLKKFRIKKVKIKH